MSVNVGMWAIWNFMAVDRSNCHGEGEAGQELTLWRQISNWINRRLAALPTVGFQLAEATSNVSLSQAEQTLQ